MDNIIQSPIVSTALTTHLHRTATSSDDRITVSTGINSIFGGDLLKGMEMIQEHWDRYATGKSGDMYEDDDDFFATWGCLYSFANSEGIIVDKTVRENTIY